MSPADRLHVAGLTPGDVALLKNIADAAADQAVKKTFVAMGLDPDEPIKSQENFTALREITVMLKDEESKADRQWLRRTRKQSEGIIGKAVMTAVGVAVLGALTTAYAGIKTVLGISAMPLPPGHP